MILEYSTLFIIVIVLALIIAFLYVKDQQLIKDLSMLEEAILEIKANKPQPAQIQANSCEHYKELDAKIYELGESLIKIVRSIKNLDKNHNDLSKKVEKIEEQLKLSMLSSSSNLNEEEVMQMYKQGKDPQEIAKEKRIPLGEVELMIKLANLNDN
jgi:septal ring factor EnvC (AmiA/AmiB activator)